MLKPICSTPEALARAKAKYMEHANQLVPPSGEFQMIGRKPEEGGEPALKLVPIPGDALSVRFFPGINGTVSFDFVKGDYDGEHSMGTGLRMPQGYVVHQAFFGHLIELKGIHEDAPPSYPPTPLKPERDYERGTRPPLHHLPASPVKLSAGYASSGLKIVPFRGAPFASASASGEAGGAHRPDVLRSRARPQVVAPPSRRRFRAALTSHHPLSSSSSPLPTPCAPIDSSRRPSFDASGSGGWEAGAPVQGRVQGGKEAKKADAARVGQRAEVAAVAEYVYLYTIFFLPLSLVHLLFLLWGALEHLSSAHLASLAEWDALRGSAPSFSHPNPSTSIISAAPAAFGGGHSRFSIHTHEDGAEYMPEHDATAIRVPRLSTLDLDVPLASLTHTPAAFLERLPPVTTLDLNIPLDNDVLLLAGVVHTPALEVLNLARHGLFATVFFRRPMYTPRRDAAASLPACSTRPRAPCPEQSHISAVSRHTHRREQDWSPIPGQVAYAAAIAADVPSTPPRQTPGKGAALSPTPYSPATPAGFYQGFLERKCSQRTDSRGTPGKEGRARRWLPL
ncbi:hypothetical protein B0H11DRAFT_2223177 [Mycena galericulata]|nr:hypothetical protein B0H11DRAFT_2223177 [Mycena galericulata]